MRATTVIIVAGLLCGCASGGRAGPGEAAAGSVTVEVTNYNWSVIHAYVIVSGQRYSLGLVTTNSTESFPLPRGALTARRSLVFLAVPIGSPVAYLSDELLVAPGDTIVWTIQNNLSQSSVIVR